MDLDSKIFVAGDSGAIFTTSNKGVSWENISIPTNTNLLSISVNNSNTIFAAGERGRIFYTNDCGKNWYLQYTADSHDLFSIDFIDSACGIAVGNDGTILKTFEVGTMTNEKNKSPFISTEFKLYQNYPNPFNVSTTFGYEITRACYVTLKIYDILGRLVKILVDEYHTPNHYEIVFSGLDNENQFLSSGIYLCRLQVDGSYSETKKILLLK